jgi:hypothetical protein
MMRLTQGIGATAALLVLTTLTSIAYTDGRDWNDGPVIKDDYMHYLATT